jgi:replicative DNA helicase
MSVDDRIDDQPLPHNLDAERSVLGAAILDGSAILKAIPILPDPSHFFLPQNRLVYGAIQGLMASGKPIDTVTLMEALGASGQLEAAGGAAYLSQLAGDIPRVTNVEHYARIVRDKARLRELIHFAERLKERAFEGAEPPADLTEGAITDLLQITSGSAETARARPWQEVTKSAVDQLSAQNLILTKPRGCPSDFATWTR